MTNPRKAAPITEGEVFYGPSKTLTDAHFLMFSAVTGDVHPIHYDAEYAKQTRFGKPLAHGLLLASLTALGASSGRERCDGYVLVEQGSRFLHPAAVGDTVTPELVVERIWREGKRVMCRVQTKLTNQRGETLLEGFHVYRVLEENAAKEKK
jgi:3-hydroxybutyryl-CoA dehydratase